MHILKLCLKLKNLIRSHFNFTTSSFCVEMSENYVWHLKNSLNWAPSCYRHQSPAELKKKDIRKSLLKRLVQLVADRRIWRHTRHVLNYKMFFFSVLFYDIHMSCMWHDCSKLMYYSYDSEIIKFVSFKFINVC